VGDAYNLISHLHMTLVPLRYEHAVPTIRPGTPLFLFFYCSGIGVGALAWLLLWEAGLLPRGLSVGHIALHDADGERTRAIVDYIRAEQARGRWQGAKIYELTKRTEEVTQADVDRMCHACGGAPHVRDGGVPCQEVTMVCSQRAGFFGAGAELAGATGVSPLLEIHRVLTMIDEHHSRAGLLRAPSAHETLLVQLMQQKSMDAALPPQLRAEMAAMATRLRNLGGGEGRAGGAEEGRPRRGGGRALDSGLS